MDVTAWKGGSMDMTKPAGYGLKVKIADRDKYFCRDWKVAYLHLEGLREVVEVNVDKKSFWNDTCHELISRKIGAWLISNNLAPWPKGNPPKFEMTLIGENHFKVLVGEQEI